MQLVSVSERASTRAAIDPTRAHRPDRRPLAMPARACSRPLVSACVRSRPLVSARVRSCQLVSARVLSICPLVSTLPVCAVSGNQQRHDTSHARARPPSRVVGPWRCDRAQRRGSSVCAVPPSQGGFHQIQNVKVKAKTRVRGRFRRSEDILNFQEFVPAQIPARPDR